MRVTTLLKKILGIKSLVVEKFETVNGVLVIHVRPRCRKRRCSRCGRIRSGFNRLDLRYWRHLDFGGIAVYLAYRPRRVNCPSCGIVVEKVPWSEDPRSRFTTDFEESVGYLVQRCDKTSVTEVFQIAWRTVGTILERVCRRHGSKDPLEGLVNIGVDEVSYRKGHRYLTLVSNHATGRIIWAKEGKGARTLAAFFKDLGPKRCKAIQLVSMDMSQAYIKATRQYVPHAQIVFDRFHVQKLVSEALDQTRREEWRRQLPIYEEEAKATKGMRWALLKNPWNLTAVQSQQLSDLQRENKRLYRAYLLKESFAAILDRRQPNVAREHLEDWLSWASRSRLSSFVKAARTIRTHMQDIMAYVRFRMTNAVAEGLNNKVRLLTRRAYGFHSAEAVIAMVMLCCTGIQLTPVFKILNL